jgi:hypothetical protein
VLLREADRAVHLVGDGGADAGRFARADLRRGHRRANRDRGAAASIAASAPRRRGRLPGEHREVLLHRLEAADRAAELHALARVLHARFEHALQGARHLRAAHHRARARTASAHPAA